jgi:hypothetical protein
MKFLGPSTASSGEPRLGRAVLLPPRFRSQVFSTSQRFPGKPEFHGLVSCRNRSWASSFRAFPSQGSRTPLEAASFLAVIQQRACRTRCRWIESPGFPDAHTVTGAVAWFPRGSGSPFREPKPASRSPGTTDRGTAPFRRLHLLRSLPPPASPFTRRRVSPPPRPLLSWVSPPLKYPPEPRSLDPPGPKPGHAPSPAGSSPRPRGPAALRVR